MSENAHVALIVEDDPATAAELASYVRSLGHRAQIAATLEEVDRAIAEGGFCYVLLDKQLPATEGAMAVVATGDIAQKRLRKVDPRRNGADHHVLQILIVTGFAKTPAFIARNFLLGASGFIPKPCDAETLTEEIALALARAERADHAECASVAAPVALLRAIEERSPSPPSEPLVRLSLDGVRIGRRTSFLVNGKRRDLQDARFVVLLRLAVVRLRGSDAYVSAGELGILRTPEVPSRIHEALEGAVPEGFLLVQRGEAGARRLHPLVFVERIDWATFERHPYPGIQKIAGAERRRP